MSNVYCSRNAFLLLFKGILTSDCIGYNSWVEELSCLRHQTVKIQTIYRSVKFHHYMYMPARNH